MSTKALNSKLLNSKLLTRDLSLRPARLRHLSTALLVLNLVTLAASAQQVGQNKSASPDETFTISLKSQLVIETVVVKDKAGHPIDNLTAKDFVLTEDGAPQNIRVFEHQSLPTTAEPVAPTGPENITIYRRLTRTQLAPEAQGSKRFNNRRLLSLYFDMSAMRPDDQLRALAAAEHFVRTQMTSADLVSIMRYAGGSVDVLQDFTADHDKLMSILQTLVVGEGQGSAESVDDASSADTGAAFGQDDSEFNIFNTDRQLSALQTAARMLGQINEKKSLIYFASGLRLNGIDNQAQMKATVETAIRAGVSFWPIDARGLVASAPLGDATKGSPGNAGMYSGTAAQATTNNFQQSQDTLFALAGDTGGKALFDSNDLGKGITDAQQAITNYYILGYYTTNNALNGRFRRVKIALNPDREAKLEYREGYYAGKEFAKFTTVDKERQLEDALMLGDPITELTIAMEIDYFQLNRAEYFVPIIVKIPGRELSLAKKGGAERTQIDFVGEIKDLAGGTTISNVRDSVNIKLSDANANELAHRPIEYDFGYTLLPGKYTIKFLARDNETGRIGTYQTNFTIPNLNKEVQRVPISSVVLSSQRVDMKDALYNVMKTKDQEKETAANPLVQNGAKLIPSVTRSFSRQRPMYLYLQAYAPAATPPATPTSPTTTSPAAPTPQPQSTIATFVTFYRSGTKVLETQPITSTPGPTRLGTMPLNFTVNLTQLPPGEYDCQVTVLDPTTQKATFWQAPVLITP